MRMLLILLIISLSACGFHLRGHNLNEKNFPFSSLYLKYPAQSPFISDLQLSLEQYQIKLAATAAEADLTLEIAYERRDKQILALSGSAQVREYQLNYIVSFRAYDRQMQEWLPADEITLQRNMTYDDAQILAKEQEEALLFNDMRSDAVQQVLRRLSRAKSRPDPADMPAAESQPISANPAVRVSPADQASRPAPVK